MVLASLLLFRTDVPPDDALSSRVLSDLDSYTRWLRANGAEGYVGEVGWPDDERGDSDEWNDLADQWYERADQAGLWVTAWATGEWWQDTYPLAVYEASSKGAVDSANRQAPVVEDHPSAGYLRGVNVAGGEFGDAPSAQETSPFSNANPGEYGTAYYYDSAETFRYLADRGVRVVRIPFRWERLQPDLSGALDAAEVGRIRAAADRAEQAGLRVILDLHNFGAYYLHDGTQGVRRPIGSPELPVDTFVATWQRLSSAFRSDASVIGYGLMNEPTGLPSGDDLSAARLWEGASQRALEAIRKNGDNKLILVPGYDWSHLQGWASEHSSSWITDPVGNFRYEAHHYWDGDFSGEYAKTYEAEVAAAAAN